MTRYIVVGTDNPRSDDRRLALNPLSPGSTGETFWKMTGLSLRDYMRVFTRDNLFYLQDLTRGKAERVQAAKNVITRLDTPEELINVIALGWEVAEGFYGYRVASLRWVYVNSDLRVATVPHPSGRNRWYNSPRNTARAIDFVDATAKAALKEWEIEHVS